MYYANQTVLFVNFLSSIFENQQYWKSTKEKRVQLSVFLAITDNAGELVMSIFNQFFDDRLNRLSENRFFCDFLKFGFDQSIILTYQRPYKFNKSQLPYHGLSDRVFFKDIFYLDVKDHTTICETAVWSLTFRVKNMFEKKNEKKPVYETVVWSLADLVKNLIEKK